MADILKYIDFSKESLLISAAAIVFNPTFWNIAAQAEYRKKVITKLFGGPYAGCYALAVTIFSLGIFRDFLYERALREQPVYPPLLDSPLRIPLAVLLFVSGNTLVLTSMWALGVTGTYLGDYFGILMDSIVEGFPFNVSSAPMYVGSTLSFAATAIWFAKPAGLLLTVEVWVAYYLALRFEDPFTAEIYAKRERERRAGKKVN